MGTIDYRNYGNCYTYMGWQLITAPDSQQYKLREAAGMNFDNEGFGIINNCYVIACTTYYGNVGDYIDWVLADNSVLHTIIGDIKSSGDPNYDTYGHIIGNDLNVIEFVVDYNTWYPTHDNPGTTDCHPEWAGLIQSFNNIGNFWTGENSSTGQETFYIVKATKEAFNSEWNCLYLASYQNDGYLYFNDDTFWRCYIDGTQLQIFYIEKQIWVDSTALDNIQISKFKVSASSSNGTNANNAIVEQAVQWMIDKATNEYITYSQANRNLKNPDGTSYDCSSFVITGFYAAGLDVNATYTGNMVAGFEDKGFTFIPGSYFESTDCMRGDILIKEFDPGGHTQVYIGNNQDVNCGSTPARVQSHAPDNYGRGWDGILRWE